MQSHGVFALPARAARVVALASIVLAISMVASLAPSPAQAAHGSETTAGDHRANHSSKHGKTHGSKHGTQRGGKHADKHPSRPARKKAVRGTLAALPPIAQPGTSPAAPERNGSLVATFSPADPGRKVVLERQTRAGWKAVASGPEDASGTVAFSPAPGTYRARTTTTDRYWVTGTVTTTAWQPTFEDTFSGSTLDPTKWNDQRREHESVYAPRTCARTDPWARRVEGGVLQLGVALDPERVGMSCSYTTKRGPGTSPYMVNSQVATELTRSFRHGIFAARIKPQRAKGMHSAFWLLPEGTTYVDGDPSGGTEIDVMEFFGEAGRGKDAIGSHIHYYEPGWSKVSLGDVFPETREVLGKGRSWWDEFHVFSVEWTPTEYVFRVDGREYYREQTAVSQAQQYLVLSNLTSDYELAELTPNEMSDTAQVDWVRVFDAGSTTSTRTTSGRRTTR
ncbi:glycoside hydrolase family 16 protein [Nocardioides KLBMP 9356]|uniref:Glycoside hydrolase family 16 protein n=1 Tax=Nocardioides potassii TaxID=2911371 RepID=A0ABS9H7Z9_9ACTN|nr:glycoside hydrolase family 16 protein [Nocardioides potassii]MCF6376392.1 glycoside hydrolase family 16 protein [Nocardioides potassii]